MGCPPFIAWSFLVVGGGGFGAALFFSISNLKAVSDGDDFPWGSLVGVPLCVWGVVNALAIFVCYTLRRPRWLGKDSSGRIAAWSYVCWLPLFITLWLVYLWRHLLLDLLGFQEDLANEVSPGIWLGRLPFLSRNMGRKSAQDFAQRFAGSGCVVDLMSEFAEPAVLARPTLVDLRLHVDGSGITDSGDGIVPLDNAAPRMYRWVPSLDTLAPEVDELVCSVEAVCSFMERQAGVDVFVHCVNGHGRSATFVCCLLCALGRASSVPEAMEMMKTVRSSVNLQPPQLEVCLSAVSLLLASRDDETSSTEESRPSDGSESVDAGDSLILKSR
jgi:Swiss Army Knife protein, DSP-PTPase phosphatase domain